MGVTIDLVKKYENIVKVANNSNKAMIKKIQNHQLRLKI